MKKNNIWRIVLLAVLCFAVNFIFAQQPVIINPDNADTMRSNGKIYVVVAVALTILLGLFLYVFLIDKKLGKLEKELTN